MCKNKVSDFWKIPTHSYCGNILHISEKESGDSVVDIVQRGCRETYQMSFLVDGPHGRPWCRCVSGLRSRVCGGFTMDIMLVSSPANGTSFVGFVRLTKSVVNKCR